MPAPSRRGAPGEAPPLELLRSDDAASASRATRSERSTATDVAARSLRPGGHLGEARVGSFVDREHDADCARERQRTRPARLKIRANSPPTSTSITESTRRCACGSGSGLRIARSFNPSASIPSEAAMRSTPSGSGSAHTTRAPSSSRRRWQMIPSRRGSSNRPRAPSKPVQRLELPHPARRRLVEASVPIATAAWAARRNSRPRR